MRDGDAADMVMHAHLTSSAVEIMASDGTPKEPYETSFITLALGGTDLEKLTGIFNILAKGGKVEHELKKQFWGDTFGMLTDKFGVDWMVNVSAS
jgi:PhnB protein